MAATTNENNSFAERDPEELFCLKWNDFTVRIKLIKKSTKTLFKKKIYDKSMPISDNRN